MRFGICTIVQGVNLLWVDLNQHARTHLDLVLICQSKQPF